MSDALKVLKKHLADHTAFGRSLKDPQSLIPLIKSLTVPIFLIVEHHRQKSCHCKSDSHS